MNHYPLPQRPEAQIRALINALQGHGTIKEYPRGSCLTQNEEYINILPFVRESGAEAGLGYPYFL